MKSMKDMKGKRGVPDPVSPRFLTGRLQAARAKDAKDTKGRYLGRRRVGHEKAQKAQKISGRALIR